MHQHRKHRKHKKPRKIQFFKLNQSAASARLSPLKDAFSRSATDATVYSETAITIDNPSTLFPKKAGYAQFEVALSDPIKKAVHPYLLEVEDDMTLENPYFVGKLEVELIRLEKKDSFTWSHIEIKKGVALLLKSDREEWDTRAGLAQRFIDGEKTPGCCC
jgi:hypothetical protein